MKIILKFLVIIFLSIEISTADGISVFEFTETELSKLEVRKVRGADNKTNYSIGSNENGNFLKAVADNAASGLGKEVKINLNKTPFINITWKVEKDLSGIKENTKKGHDFAARVLLSRRLVLHHYLIEQLIMYSPAIVKLDLIHQVLILKSL